MLVRAILILDALCSLPVLCGVAGVQSQSIIVDRQMKRVIADDIPWADIKFHEWRSSISWTAQEPTRGKWWRT
eukprot:5987-Eustigmatos_ZCMA.PRE.1